MRNNGFIGKSLIAGTLALSLAFGPAINFVPAVNAAGAIEVSSSIAKVEGVKYEIYYTDNMVPCVKFTWKAVNGTDRYRYRYNTNYDPENPSDNNYIEEEMDQADTSIEIPVGDDYNAVWFQVASMTADKMGEFSDAVYASKDTIDGNLDAAKKEAEARKVMIKKAKALAKKDKKKEGVGASYGLHDINGDGFDELFYARAYNRAEIFVYRYNADKNKAVLVKTT
ncbi:MAG: hypothetical protein K6F00_09495, partial [Lachnospiraceae bacterium]|nr:hypothetical protein [Lachnospiraceae bacterium]